jgi:GNAT superfamily N-acetyltransferase
VERRETIIVRDATEADLEAITSIAKATGLEQAWTPDYPGYVRYLIRHGRFLVGGQDGAVTGFGATRRLGEGQAAISMLTDLFVDPRAHGTGTGRTILSALWTDQPRRMTFSSLHSNALPLYTSFGVDAWWPLLYLRGPTSRLTTPAGWSVRTTAPRVVAELELAWTGIDKAADHEMWAARPAGVSVIVSFEGRPVAAGTAGGAGADYGVSHLSVDAASLATLGRDAAAHKPSDLYAAAADAVIATLCSLDAPDAQVHLCLPAPHPAVRPLLAAGWKIGEFDLYMASEPGLIDPHLAVPSPDLG